MIDSPVDRRAHIGKRLVKLLFQFLVITKLVKEKGSLDRGKLLCGPFSEQVVKEACRGLSAQEPQEKLARGLILTEGFNNKLIQIMAVLKPGVDHGKIDLPLQGDRHYE